MQNRGGIDWMAVAVGTGLATAGFVLGAMAFGRNDIPTEIAFAAGLAFFGALGTWVVGLGANNYAKASTALQRQQAASKTISDYNALRTAVISCQLAYSVIEKMLEVPDDHEPTQASLHTAMETGASLLPKPNIAVSPYPVPDDTIVLLQSLDASIAMFHVSVKQFSLTHERIHKTPSKDANEEFSHAISGLRSLRDKAMEAGTQIDKIRPSFLQP